MRSRISRPGVILLSRTTSNNRFNEVAEADQHGSHGDITLVFSDVVMPRPMEGFGLARWIGNHHPKIPILLTSGYWGERPPSEFGAAPLLPKPYSFDKLRNCLVGLIGVPLQLTE